MSATALTVESVLASLTLEEKAGLMFHSAIFMNPDGSDIEDTTASRSPERHLNTFNIYYAPEPRIQAEWHNRLQEIAASTRSGIPVTISSDPRQASRTTSAPRWSAGGVLALARADRLRRARRRRGGASTSPTWPGRSTARSASGRPAPDGRSGHRAALGADYGTFGEDADLAAPLVAAYIRGFQGDELGPESVACMTKHFPGGGPQKDGEDPHFPYGRNRSIPAACSSTICAPFEAAFAAGTAQIMPYYGMPVGTRVRGGRLWFQPGRRYRPAARAVRL